MKFHFTPRYGQLDTMSITMYTELIPGAQFKIERGDNSLTLVLNNPKAEVRERIKNTLSNSVGTWEDLDMRVEE